MNKPVTKTYQEALREITLAKRLMLKTRPGTINRNMALATLEATELRVFNELVIADTMTVTIEELQAFCDACYSEDAIGKRATDYRDELLAIEIDDAKTPSAAYEAFKKCPAGSSLSVIAFTKMVDLTPDNADKAS